MLTWLTKIHTIQRVNENTQQQNDSIYVGFLLLSISCSPQIAVSCFLVSILFEVTWPSWQAGVSSGTDSEPCAGPVPAWSPHGVYVASSSSTIKSPNYSGRNFCPKQICLSESNWIACIEASTNRMFPFKCYGLLAHMRITQGST